MQSINNLIDYMERMFGHLVEPPYFYLVAAGFVILLVLWIWLAYARNTRGIIPFKTQGGTIEIAPSTLRGVMQHAANNVQGVEKATCHHFVKGRRVGVRVAIHLEANSRLKDVDAQIKHNIQATLLEQFGMEHVEPIHIRVSKIVGDLIPRNMPKMLEASEDDDRSMIDLDDDDERPYADETKI